MLDLGKDAGRDILVAIARHAAARGADAGEIVLLRVDVTPAPTAGPIGQMVGLDDHLKECVVPADAPGFAMRLVPAGDVTETRIKLRVALAQERHQPFRRYAGGHPILTAGSDWRRGGNHGWCRHRQNSE